MLTGGLEGDRMGTMKGAASPRRKWGSLSEAGSPYLENRIAVLGKDTISGKWAKMVKAGACQELETPAVVAEELYPKTGSNRGGHKNGKSWL